MLLPTRTQVVIIGAGYAGLATGWWLLANGVQDFVIVEKGATPCNAASGRGAGLGRQLCEDDETTALAVWGAQFLRAGAHGFADVWQPTGGLLKFNSSAHLASYLERAARFGIAVEPQGLDLWVASDGIIDVQKLGKALSAPLAAHIHTCCDVQAVTPAAKVASDDASDDVAVDRARVADGVALTVLTSGGPRQLVADIVVDAAGAWGGRLVGQANLTPMLRHLVFADAAADATSDASVTRAAFIWRVEDQQAYVRPYEDHFMFSPCDETRVDADAPLTVRPDIVAYAEQVAKLANLGRPLRWAQGHAKSCVRTFTPDRKMLIARSPQHRWLVSVLGLGGHGATACPAVGKQAAALVAQALASGR